MAFFDSFTDSLKQKWLQFFQINRDWIILHMEVESVYTPDGGKRPPSYLILGVVNALEPKLAQLMLPFSKLNADADTLIEVLELHFDPDMALGNIVLPKADIEKHGESAVVIDEITYDETLTISPTNGFGTGVIAPELEIMDSHEETLMVPNITMEDELREMSLDDFAQAKDSKENQNGFGDHSSSNNQNSTNESHHESGNAVDEFGDISFDDFKEIDSNITDSSAQDDNGFGDVMSDVWGDENIADKDEADNEMFLGEELHKSAFDDSEIARLFPKA